MTIGRELLPDTDDDRLSRRHAQLTWDGRQFEITDLGSRNGTNLAATPLIHQSAKATPRAVVRTGRTIFVLNFDSVPNVPLETVSHDGLVVGPSTFHAYQAMLQAATNRQHVLITGEAGTGKTRYARLLAKRMAEPTAIFDPSVHAIAMDRVIGKATTIIIEQIGKLGDAHRIALRNLLATRTDVRIIVTSTAPLAEVGVPADLIAALAGPTIHLPPLRERFDELPTLLAQTLATVEPTLVIHATLVEASLLRPWPSNLHDLLSQLQICAHSVANQGKTHIRGEDLSNEAGQLMMGPPTIHAGAQQTIANLLRKSRPEE
ncbi:MAG: FHA domain-containing protein [Kofleriaceae bacterium]|nr:FHA domain-containing protein [Kofleriaceae bacterium]